MIGVIKVQQELINKCSPVIYRSIGQRLLLKFPNRRITRYDLRLTLGSSFKVDKHHQGRVINELIDFGMVIQINKFDYFINWVDIEDNR